MDKTEANIVITRNKLVQKLVKEYSEAKIEEQDRYGPKNCSGSKIRENIRKNKDWKYLVPDCGIEKIEENRHIIERTEG